MTDDTQLHQVGVVGLPHLADALAKAGVAVVTGADFRSAAAAVTSTMRSAPNLPLLVADVAAPGTTPWLEKVLRSAPGALVGVPVPTGSARVAGNTGQVPRVGLPVDVRELLAGVGLSVPPALSGCRLLADGTVVHPDGDLEPAPTGLNLVVASDEPDDLDDVDVDVPELVSPRAPAVSFPPPPVATGAPPPSAPSGSADEKGGAPVRVQATAPLPVPDRTRPAGPLPHLGRSLAAPAARARLILTVAGKGGVGKSTAAMVLAQRAASVAGLKVAVVDGNRGQGDLRTYLRLNRASLPSVYDVAAGGEPADAIISPERLAAVRPDGSESLDFALVLAPPAGMADRAQVTTEVYARVVEHLRGIADLVVVDTQIIESADASGLFDELWVPALAADSYAVGLSDLSTPGLRNLMERLQDLTSRGVPTDRLFTLLNRVPPSVSFDEQSAGDSFARFSHYVGRVRADDQVIEEMGHGALPWRRPDMAVVADRVLLHVTGDPRFAQQPERPSSAAGARWRLPFLRGRS